MNIYLGHKIDAGTFHFEFETCPACSVSTDKGGRMLRKPFKIRKKQENDVVVVPEYSQRKNTIRDTRKNLGYLHREGKLCYLQCSRSPECKYEVLELFKIVLLKSESELESAQSAYRGSY